MKIAAQIGTIAIGSPAMITDQTEHGYNELAGKAQRRIRPKKNAI
jgi:hypothetical protein